MDSLLVKGCYKQEIKIDGYFIILASNGLYIECYIKLTVTHKHTSNNKKVSYPVKNVHDLVPPLERKKTNLLLISCGL